MGTNSSKEGGRGAGGGDTFSAIAPAHGRPSSTHKTAGSAKSGAPRPPSGSGVASGSTGAGAGGGGGAGDGRTGRYSTKPRTDASGTHFFASDMARSADEVGASPYLSASPLGPAPPEAARGGRARDMRPEIAERGRSLFAQFLSQQKTGEATGKVRGVRVEDLLTSPYLDTDDEDGGREEIIRKRYNFFPSADRRDRRRFLRSYKWCEALGSGTTAHVRRVVDKITNKNYACKIVPKAGLNRHSRAAMEFELDVLRQSKSRHVVHLQDTLVTPRAYYIVMEMLPTNLLQQVVSANETLSYSEASAAAIVRDLAAALAHVHDHNIAHLDIKPDNVLIDKHGAARLADFGMATKVPARRTVGTALFVAPEILSEGHAYTVSDVWSLGVLTYAICCGYCPFMPGPTRADTLNSKICSAKYSFPDKDWSAVSESAKDLIRRMLVVDYRQRITSAQILKHEWVRGAAPHTPLPHVGRRLSRFARVARGVRALVRLHRTVSVKDSETPSPTGERPMGSRTASMEDVYPRVSKRGESAVRTILKASKTQPKRISDPTGSVGGGGGDESATTSLAAAAAAAAAATRASSAPAPVPPPKRGPAPPPRRGVAASTTRSTGGGSRSGRHAPPPARTATTSTSRATTGGSRVPGAKSSAGSRARHAPAPAAAHASSSRRDPSQPSVIRYQRAVSREVYEETIDDADFTAPAPPPRSAPRDTRTEKKAGEKKGYWGLRRSSATGIVVGSHAGSKTVQRPILMAPAYKRNLSIETDPGTDIETPQSKGWRTPTGGAAVPGRIM